MSYMEWAWHDPMVIKLEVRWDDIMVEGGWVEGGWRKGGRSGWRRA